MEDRIRELLRERAEDVLPALWDMPARAQRRAHRRAAFTIGATALTVAALVVGTVVGVRQLTAAPPLVPATPGPSLVPVTHHNGEIVVFQSGGLIAIDPATGNLHKLLDCPPQTDGQTCNVRYDEAWSPDGTTGLRSDASCVRTRAFLGDTCEFPVGDLRSGSEHGKVPQDLVV